MWGIICILGTLFWSCTLSQKCITPFGKSSKCVKLSDCPDFYNDLTVKSYYYYNQKPPSQHKLKFLEKSKCSLEGTTKVCCGPIPDENPDSVITPSQGTQFENFTEDSSPAPSDQCGKHFEHRIYSGKDTELHEFPWMALLGYKNNLGTVSYKCGGSLINRRYVLTAAHCLSNGYTDKYGPITTVRLGEYDMSNESTVDCKYGVCADQPQEIPVASTYVHPQYETTNPNRTHDIAIVKLASRAVYTDYIQPICLGQELVYSDETELFFCGWGWTLEGASNPVKQKINLTFFNKENCIEKFSERGSFLSDMQFCAGGRFREGGCQGDSGGPLMRAQEGIWEVVGVGSFGRGCGLDGWPGVYTSVAHYLGWIESILKNT